VAGAGPLVPRWRRRRRWVRPISSLYRTCSMLQLESYCESGSSTTSSLTFETDSRLHWLPVQQRIKRKVCAWCTSVCVRLDQHYTPSWTVLPLVSESTSRGHLRSAARGDLALPRSRTTRYGQRCLAVSGPTLWNSLPLSLRDSSLTLTQFRALLKTVLFRRAHETLTYSAIDVTA